MLDSHNLTLDSHNLTLDSHNLTLDSQILTLDSHNLTLSILCSGEPQRYWQTLASVHSQALEGPNLQ